MKNTVYIALAVILSLAVIVAYIYRRQETFEGKIIDKQDLEIPNISGGDSDPSGILNNSYTGGYKNVTHAFTVKVQTADGKTKTLDVTKVKFDNIQVGDHVIKPKGTTDLQIVKM